MWRGDSPAPTSRFRNEGLRSPLCMTIFFIMTDIEALLSVDAGQVPEGTVAFFTRDPERGQRRLYLVTGALLLLGAVASAIAGTGFAATAVLFLGAGIFG